MPKKPEIQQIDFEHDIFLAFHLFFIMGGKINQLFPELDVPPKPKNPYLDPEQTHPKYALLTIILREGIEKHINLLPYVLRYPAHFNNVKEIRIQYSWAGLSDTGETNSEYRLQIKDGMLMGEGRFAIGYQTIKKSTYISIPAETVKSFLTILETIKIEDKPCRSGRFATDHYPYVSITLFTETGLTKMASTSQLKGYIPWCAILQGHQYKIDSDIPAQALKILEPYLKRYIIDKMIDEFKYRSYTPTTT